MTSIDIADEIGATLIEEINDLLDEIQQTFRDIEVAVNDAISSIPWVLGWMADGIRLAWDAACDKISEFWEFIDETVGSEIGNTTRIHTVEVFWAREVGGPVSAQVAVAEAGNLESDDAWQGDAAQAYRDRLSLHKAALAAVQTTLTNGIVGGLEKVRDALVVYFWAIIAALSALIVALLVAIGSILGGPTVVVGLLAVGGGILTAITAITVARFHLESKSNAAKMDMELVVNSSTAFGWDHWPAGALS